MQREPDEVTVGLRVQGTRRHLGPALQEFQEQHDLKLLPWSPYGGWPIPLDRFDRLLVERAAEQGRRVRPLDGIQGGEVGPHVHLGDEIYLLEPVAFRALIGEVAAKLSREFAARAAHEDVIDLMSQFMIDTVPLPEKQLH